MTPTSSCAVAFEGVGDGVGEIDQQGAIDIFQVLNFQFGFEGIAAAAGDQACMNSVRRRGSLPRR